LPYFEVGKENSGEIELYYNDHGSGKPVVLIHGWPLNGASWEKQTLALLDSGHRVISYDRRGFGKSSRPTIGYDYDTFADDLHKLASKLGLRDFTLVGFSMGGGEVARYIGKHGTKNVAGAVFISAVPPFLLKTSDNPQGVDKSIFDGMKFAISQDRLAFLSKFLADFYNVDVLKGKSVTDQVVQWSWNAAASASPRGTIDCVTAFGGTDFRKDLEKIDVPTLVIHGTEDRIVPFAISGQKTADAVKGSKLVAIDGAPHGLIWTHADQANKALLDFVGAPSKPETAKVAAR
jgi:non-heme chloroperoxidase